jgi:hypothetical protein
VARALPNQEEFDRAVGYLTECRTFHADLMDKIATRYDAYKAIVATVSDAAQWTSKLYPPYIMHIVETSLASMVDDKLRYRIRPRATLETYFDPGAGERARLGAEAHQILFDWQVKQSKLQAELRPFVLQNAIAGLTVAKTLWTEREERRRQLAAVEEPLFDEQDQPIYGPDGQQLTRVRLEEQVKMITVYDGPVTETRDLHDFMWHESATKLENARYLVDRVWVSPEDFWKGYSGEHPTWGESRGGWTEKKARQILGSAPDYSDDHADRWGEKGTRQTTKDLIEVCEVWDQVRKTVTTIVNRAVLASHKEKYPFFFETPPFVACTTQSDLFKVVGISQVEKAMPLQKMIWDVMNQRLDNLRLINNAIFFFRPDLEDPDAYEFEPGAQWPLEDPTQVGQWQPNPIPAEISLGAEALMKGDMQNLAGGFPFSSGTDSQYVDQKTATGASIVTQIAQRSIDMSKKAIYEAWEQVGQQRMVLNQQFIREPTIAPVLGVDDQETLEIIMPELLQGDFNFEIEPIADALAKQEEQASGQALFQLGLAAVPVFAGLAAQGQARMINVDALWEDVLKSFGKEDKERYFKSSAPAIMPPGPGGAEGQAAPGTPLGQDAPQGVTAQQSIDPAVSPSSNMSLSPVGHLHRAQALSRGGAMNV